MRSILHLLLTGGALCLNAVAEPGPEPVLRREANETLQLPLSPPLHDYVTERAFGDLEFLNPVAIATPPGETNRLFVVEQRGVIRVIPDLTNPTAETFLDLTGRVVGGDPPDERGLLGLAFHPGYATNRFFYVFFTGTETTGGWTGLHEILARFEASPDNPNAAIRESELVVLRQFDEANNHNGGDLHFGPDGYLYVSLGDEGGANDQYNNSQRIDRDFFSGILRIDVDKRPGSLAPNLHPAVTENYAVPPDNPFVGATEFNGRPVDPGSVRTEFYAVGLRNPWRMSFDPVTGNLYAGDVGQNAREEIDWIVAGGNYGWAYREGNINGVKANQAPPGFVGIPPLEDYPRSGPANQIGRSVTGGVVYRGSRFRELSGSYVFADYVSGNVWASRYDGTNVVSSRWLLREGSIAGFGVDPSNGDVLMADQDDDTVLRLVQSTNVTGTPFPPTLAETGAFSDLASLTPNPGIVRYEVNLPVWSDHAVSTRWFSVPDTNDVIQFSREGAWTFPAGTVWIEQIDLPLTNGVPESARRLETRFLVQGTNGLYGITYRWDDSQTNAVLVPEEGLEESFVIQDSGMVRTQVWEFPSRRDIPVLTAGFNTRQLNRVVDYGGRMENQLSALSAAGYFDTDLIEVHTLPAFAHPDDASQSLEYRVRSYLAVNCAGCHYPGGRGLGFFDARITTPTSEAGLIEGPLVRDEGDSENRVIRPGSVERSMLVTRMAMLGPGHMPPVGSNLVDTNAVQLLSEWITNDLPSYRTFAQWQTERFGGTNAPGSGRLEDPDQDGAPNYLEYLTGGDPASATNVWKASIQRSDGAVQIVFQRLANRGFQVQATTNVTASPVWAPLNVPGNALIFPATNSTAIVEDSATNAPMKFYRVGVFEP